MKHLALLPMLLLCTVSFGQNRTGQESEKKEVNENDTMKTMQW